MTWDWLPLPEHEEPDADAGDAQPTGVAPGKRTLTQAFPPRAGQPASRASTGSDDDVDGAGATAPGSTGGGTGLPDVSAAVHVPNGDHVIEISHDAGQWTVAGQLKVTFANAAPASVKASGTPAAGPDNNVAGKVDLATLQRKGIWRPLDKNDGRRLTNRIALSAMKPSAKLEELYPGLSVSVGGELGQTSLTSAGDSDVPAISLGSINLTVTGDMTTWFLNDRAKQAGIKVELIAQIRLRIDPKDLRHLARAVELGQRLKRLAGQSETLAEQIRRANAAIASARAKLAAARARGARGAKVADKLARKLARLEGKRLARRKTAGALAKLVEQTSRELGEALGKVRGAAGRLASAAFAKSAAKIVSGVLRVLGAVMIVLDVIDIIGALRAIWMSAASPHLGGGGGKAAADGDTPDGNSTTIGTPGALGIGDPDHAPPDAGATGGGITDERGGGGLGDLDAGEADAADAADDEAGDDAAGDDADASASDDPDAGAADASAGDAAGSADADGADGSAGDPAAGTGGSGNGAADAPGGPGAGAASGAAASYDDTASGLPGAPADRVDALSDGLSGSGNVAVPRTSSAVAAAGSDPASPVPMIVSNPNAARLLSALDGLGQPVSPHVVELVDVLVPDDLAPEQMTALIDRMMRSIPNGHDADEDVLIAALARTVADFLADQDTLRAEPAPRPGRERGRGGRGKRRRRRRAAVAATAAGAGATAQGTKAVRVRGGAGLTPTFYDDGGLELTQRQLEQWLAFDDGEVKRSDAATRWLAEHQHQLPLDGTRKSRTLSDAIVTGRRLGPEVYQVEVAFTFSAPGVQPVTRRVKLEFDRNAPAGRRASQQRPASMSALTRLVIDKAFEPLTLIHDKAVDMGGFWAMVVQSNTPMPDLAHKFGLFTITIEITDVTDPGLVEWMGQPVEKGARITAMVRIPLFVP